jgi:DNA mismatch repair protein MutS
LAVAALAGVPKPVVAHARALLAQLEQGEGLGHGQLDLFQGGSNESAAPDPRIDTWREAFELMETLDPDTLTPREALDVLYRWRQRFGPRIHRNAESDT